MNNVRKRIVGLVLTGLGRLSAPSVEEGQTLVEYALVLVLIALAVVATLTFLGTTIDSIFGDVASSL
jgi:pilus assembly protein Flp/PilA